LLDLFVIQREVKFTSCTLDGRSGGRARIICCHYSKSSVDFVQNRRFGGS
jgi:hypothetical protein